MANNSLPTPNPELQVHSQQLVEKIRQTIAVNQGFISFADYMEMALYTPGLGYYSGGLPKFGPSGDFTTAPELSSLFGFCLAEQCAEILTQTQGAILEFGAGSGKLALDILTALEQNHRLPASYQILEPSAELQQRQRQTFETKAPHLLPYVHWLKRLPEKFSGVVIANEVLDAMPVHVVELTGQTQYELGVGWQQDKLIWQRQPIPVNSALAKQIARLQLYLPKTDESYISEISLLIPAWINSLAEMLIEGAAILIDYGFPTHEYYHPQRTKGTLMCHYRHQSHTDPFWYPGLQDITAHVDFTAVAEAAVDARMEVAGYTTQANFLINCGLANLLNQLADSEVIQFQLNQQAKVLTLPHEMGELFKVIALTKGVKMELQGFKWGDQRHKL